MAKRSKPRARALEKSDTDVDGAVFARLFVALGEPALQRLASMTKHSSLASEMTVSMRIESGFELCEFAVELAGSKHE